MDLTQFKLSCKESKLKEKFFKKQSRLLRRTDIVKRMRHLNAKNPKLYNDQD
jgi:hypothetical protein